MLIKLSLGNIRKSLRDYAIYFFTLVIGVSVFYVFNAVSEQAVMMEVAESREDIIELLTEMLSGVSVFVACVLGLLIVYASRFLMKRRNKEFALYITLGMSKGKISAILLIETIIIGVFSLAIGLIFGIGLSQLMSALVADLFEADMTSYRFVVSGDAILKTVIYFMAIYIVVISLSSFAISKMKLIDLIHSDKKSEKIKLKNPIICVILFLVSVIALGYAYYQVGWNYYELSGGRLLINIAIGAVSTFIILWSVSGMILRIVMKRNIYYRGLNAFTFRQISSKVNTMVFSMTVICLMIFVTICTLCAAFTVRNTMNNNLKNLCPADFEVELSVYTDGDMTERTYSDVRGFYEDYDYDLVENFSEYVNFHSYIDNRFTFGSFLGDKLDEYAAQYKFLVYDVPFDLFRVSDYNTLMRLYGREELTLDDGEFILLCTYKSSKGILDEVLDEDYSINILGHELHSKYDACQDGFIDLSSQNINSGIFIVPDSIVTSADAYRDYIIGNYEAEDAEEYTKIENDIRTTTDNILENYRANGKQSEEHYYNITLNTRADISETTVGLGAMIAFLGLYVGVVFLIACGAILALKELSESVDSIKRYEMLRKIGAAEGDISRSVFRQTGIFFLIPLLLACVHSVFGMKFAVQFLEVFGTEKIWESIIVTSAIILLIYGGYFLVTLYSSRQIIRENSHAS